MIGIIEDWLLNKIGVSVNLNNVSDNIIFKDGSLIFSIFQKHGLVDLNFLDNITSSSDEIQFLQNLKKFKPLFDMLKVNYDEDVMLNIVEGNAIVIYKLLYELYVHFENKQHLYITTSKNDNKKQNNLINPSSLDHSKVNNPVCDIRLDLKNPLIENKDVIDWYRNKYNVVKQNSDLRALRLKNNTSNIRINQSKNICDCTNNSSLMEQLPDFDKFPGPKVEYEKLLDYSEFITSYKEKQWKVARNKCFQKDMHHHLLDETWNKIKQKQKGISNTVFSELMLKQSNYEKQILTKLNQTQLQVKLQNEYRNKINRDICRVEESHISLETNCEEYIEKMYVEEKKRVQELHKKLYKEKQDKIKKRHYSLCHDIINELINIADLYFEYREQYNIPVPKRLWNNWMQMFIKGQSVHIPFERLEREEVSNDCELDYNDIIYLEQLQDDVLNKNDIDEYLLTCGKWYYKHICLDRANVNNNILGHIVYRLLFMKYPSEPSPLPADLPQFKIAGILNNFNNTEVTEKLNSLLSKQGIHIFNPENAIKKCIDVYKQQTSSDTEEGPRGKKQKQKNGKPNQINESLAKGKTNSNPNAKSKTNKPKKTDDNVVEKTDEMAFTDKETQTSFIAPPDDDMLRQISLGKIGENVLNILKEGEQINDDMMVSVIIEYLKCLDGFEGWILVDFPINLKQAFILERALSGKCLPIENYTLQEIKSDQQHLINELNEKRKSKILDNPHANVEVQFQTYFSIFIKGKKMMLEEYNEKKELNDNDLSNKELHTMIGSKDKEIEKQPLDTLEKFYKDQSIFREFDFVNCDLDTLKKLAEVIFEVYEYSGLRSSQLVKEKMSQSPDIDANNVGNSVTPLSPSPKVPVKRGKNKKDSSMKEEIVEKEINISKNISLEDKNKSVEQDDQRIAIVPGDDEWEYISLPIDNELASILATVWENIEQKYLSNLEDTFFENRTIYSRLVPYSKYSKDEMDKVREKPNIRQNLISNFQENYNSIEAELRTVSQVKCQLHCKVLELQQNLFKITDDIKDETELRRQYVIKENWLVNEICLLINNYLSLIETEFEMSLETLKLLNFYYLSMLGRDLPASIDIPNGKLNMTKLTTEMLQDETEYNSSEKGSYKAGHDSFNSETQVSRENFIVKSLIGCEEPEKTITILQNIMLQNSELAKGNFQHVMHYFYNQVKTETNLLVLSVKKSAKEKSTNKKQPTKAEPKKSMNVKHLETETPVKEVSDIELLMNEWTFALDTIRDNFSIQMSLIEARVADDISEFYSYFGTVFCDLYNSNLQQFENDISKINKICEFFRTAIEEETSLRHDLIFRNTNFFIKTCENLVNNRSYNIRSLTENSHDCYFTINQLKHLKEIFMIAGPNGVIRKQAFSYIFLDLALLNDKDNQPCLPKMWRQMNESQLTEIIDSLLGPEYGVDWRDFIIYNLNISFPTIDQILLLRKRFLSYELQGTEMVSKEHYDNITLWFEEDLPTNPEEGLRLEMVKQLVFELFQVNEKYIKYTSLLLYFCKDFDPKNGLRKALSLSIGKHLIINKNELDRILEEENEILTTVTNILSEIINCIIQDREGVLIVEIDDDNECRYIEENSSYSVSLSSDSKVTSEEELSKQSSFISSNKQDDETLEIKNSESLTIHVPNKWWVSKIPLATIESVLNASFYLVDGTFSITKLYLDHLEYESIIDGTIEGHTLMSSICIKKLFAATNKFMISLPCDIIQQQFQAKGKKGYII